MGQLTVTEVSRLERAEFEALTPEQLTVLLEEFEFDLSESQKLILLEVIDNLDNGEEDEEDEEGATQNTGDTQELPPTPPLVTPTEASPLPAGVGQHDTPTNLQDYPARHERYDADIVDTKRVLLRQGDVAEIESGVTEERARVEPEHNEIRTLDGLMLDKKSDKRSMDLNEAATAGRREANTRCERGVDQALQKRREQEDAPKLQRKMEEDRRHAAAVASEAKRAEARARTEADRKRIAEEQAAEQARIRKSSAEKSLAQREAGLDKKRVFEVAEQQGAERDIESEKQYVATRMTTTIESLSKSRPSSTGSASVDDFPNSSEYSNVPQTFQASVDNLDWEVETKKKTKLVEEAREYRNALAWVYEVTGVVPADHALADDADGHVKFGNALQDGVLLCKLINAMKPGTVPNAKASTTAFIQLSNITSFNRGCQKLGLQKRECFDAQDLQKQLDLRPVLHTLHALSRVARGIGFRGPFLGYS